MKFNSPQELLNYICDFDLYSPSENIYVFLYNDLGSICVYDNITPGRAEQLKKKKYNWSSYLGWCGSSIYDSEEWIIEHEGEENIIHAKELHQLPIQWAEDYYDVDDWEDVSKTDTDVCPVHNNDNDEW